MSQEDNLQEAIDAVVELKASVDQLAHRADVNKENIRKGETRDRWLAISVALDIILSIFLAGGGWWLTNIQQTQEQGTELTRSNQCALVNMFLEFENSSTSNPNLTPQEREDRKKSYASIHIIHDNLKCSNE